MKSIKRTLLICTTLLATGAFASQYPTSPAQQSSQPGQMPQSQGSMQQPGQTAPGATQPGQPQAAQPEQQAPQPGRPSIDDQVKMLTQELNLTPDQQTKMKGVLEDQHSQAMTIMNDSSTPREDKIQKIRSLRETTISKARAMLTDDQKKKLDAMLQESDHMRQQAPSGAPGATQPGTGTSSPSSSQPSTNPPGKPPR